MCYVFNSKRFVNDWSVFIASNTDKALLHTLNHDDFRELFPVPEHFLRKKWVWALISPEETGYLLCLKIPSKRHIVSNCVCCLTLANYFFICFFRMRIPSYQTKLTLVKQELCLYLEEQLQLAPRHPLIWLRKAKWRHYRFPVLQNMWSIQTVTWSKLISITLK